MVLYSQKGCPMCSMLKSKLDEKGMEYEIVSDTNEMQRQGITHIPMLKADERSELMDFASAIKYISEVK